MTCDFENTTCYIYLHAINHLKIIICPGVLEYSFCVNSINVYVFILMHGIPTPFHTSSIISICFSIRIAQTSGQYQHAACQRAYAYTYICTYPTHNQRVVHSIQTTESPDKYRFGYHTNGNSNRHIPNYSRTLSNA